MRHAVEAWTVVEVMMTQKLEFYFFIGSTYTYLTVMRLEAVAAAAGVTVEWRPFFLRSILQEQNYSPFVGWPAKLNYMWRDVARRAKRHNLEFGSIPPYPVDPDGLANRVAYVASLEGWCGAYTRATYRDWFLQHRVPGERAHTASLLTHLRRNAETIITRADSDEIRTGLESATRTAATKGIFGSPTFVVGEEIFWGDDRLEDAIEWLRDLPRSAPTH
jgi:2-hydroxychromene-2-carboxylate isomerase